MAAEILAMSPRVALVLSTALVLAVACDQKSSSPPAARPGEAFVVTRDTEFYDSGCAQGRANDGKLKKGTRFTLVGASGSCWNVRLADEDEVYIQPANVAPAN